MPADGAIAKADEVLGVIASSTKTDADAREMLAGLLKIAEEQNHEAAQKVLFLAKLRMDFRILLGKWPS